MSLTSTGLPSVATAVRVQRQALHEATHRARGRARAPLAPLGADLGAAMGVTAVVSVLTPAGWPSAAAVFAVTWPAAVAATGGYLREPGARVPVRTQALVKAGLLLAFTSLAMMAFAPGLLAHTLTGSGPATSAEPTRAARYLLLATVLAPALSMLARSTIARALTRHPARVVLVGHADGVRALLAEARRKVGSAHPVMQPVGICLDRAASTDMVPLLEEAAGIQVEFGTERLMSLVRGVDADAVIVTAGPEFDHSLLRRWSAWLQDAGVHLLVSPGLHDVAERRIRMSALGASRIFHLRPAPLSGAARATKELADRILAALLLTLFAPLIGALAIMIRRDSPGPALFRQVRVGRDGRQFQVLKLRTMRIDADRAVDALAAENEADRAGVLFKIKQDPRITRLGATLRKYSLDELPQLLNVVRGEMSLIGPRPALPSEVAAYSPDLRRRLAVKPGLTGLWQVSGRSDLPWDETVRLDLAYVDNWSWSLDVAIAARTVTAVLSHKGAY